MYDAQTQATILRVARRYRKAEFDFNLSSQAELLKVSKFLASQVPSMDGPSVAYGAYTALGVFQEMKATLVVGELKDALVLEYGKRLLEWFRFALLKRANLGGGNKQLATSLSALIADIPLALVQDRLPKFSLARRKDIEDEINIKGLKPAVQKIMTMVQADAHEADVLKGPIQALRLAHSRRLADTMPAFPVKWDDRDRVWYIASRDTFYWKDVIKKMYFRWNPGDRRWERDQLPANIARNFTVEHRPGAPSITPPAPPAAPPPPPAMPAPEAIEALKAWFGEVWYPKNKDYLAGVLSAMRGTQTYHSVILGDMTPAGPAIEIKHRMTTLLEAVESLRHRYIGHSGREPWLETMDEVLNLAKASAPDQVVHLIDRLNNLQHSNGLFMEHFPPKVKAWYLDFLNAKYHAPTPVELARYIPDSDLRQFLTEAARWDEGKMWHPEDTRPFEKMKKEDQSGHEEGHKWRDLGYPLAPGERERRREDPEVQQGLDEVRDPGLRERKEREKREREEAEQKILDEKIQVQRDKQRALEEKWQKMREEEERTKQWSGDEDFSPEWRGRQAKLLEQRWGRSLPRPARRP
ncbi:MAG: hypothetical protein A2Y38_10405 [Spirochaetes bacterium GWB1_59_5]|nr:MAG: hypothetical protein A2Y38_10405 [Spirochaetes bacterium GWB1_59_5]